MIITIIAIIVTVIVIVLVLWFCDNKEIHRVEDIALTRGQYILSTIALEKDINKMRDLKVPDDEIRNLVNGTVLCVSLLDDLQKGVKREDYQILQLDESMKVFPEVKNLG